MWDKEYRDITIESTLVTFVSLVTGERIVLIFFLILHPPILLETSVSFVTRYGMKNHDITITSIFVTFVPLVVGEKMAQNFLCFLFLPITYVSSRMNN